jgi:hypothetical protein
MKYYHVNREERHFGFLFLTSLISYTDFRTEMFAVMNSCASMRLNPLDFDVYAEVAIFRDYWNKLGDHNKYNDKLHSMRLTVLKEILSAQAIDPVLIQEHDMFWTGPIGKSKLWYPGKWSETKIQNIETMRGIDDKRLWRCRWLCNAKPDVMIHSGNDVLFIEMKVESGMGASDHGYDQEQTQDDIITAGKRVIDWMKNANVRRLILSHREDIIGITWKQVIDVYNRTVTKPDSGAEMIARHLQHMPKACKAL